MFQTNNIPLPFRWILPLGFFFVMWLPTNLLSKEIPNHQIQLRVTYQDPDFRTPWRSKNPGSRLVLGTYLGKNQILTLASFLTNQTLVEARSLEEPSSKTARLVRLDYESDLAILEIQDPGNLFTKTRPVQFQDTISTKEKAYLQSLDGSGEPEKTSGKLENLQLGLYPEGRVNLPYVEFSSTEKLRGIGELVLDEKNRAVGILNEFSNSSGKGKVIPGRILAYFLDGNREFSYKGFLYRPLTDKTTKDYYGLSQKENGVLVSEILPDSSAEGVLKVEDIILKIGDFDVDGKGRIDHPDHGKVSFAYLLQAGQEYGYETGKTAPIVILRNKKKKKLNLPLKPYPETSVLIPHGSPRGISPGYMIAGGLFFTELSEFYLREFGRSWRSNVDKKMLYFLDYHKYRKKGQKERRIVYLIQVLPDEGNNGYHKYRHQRLVSINGENVLDLSHASRMIRKLKSDETAKFLFDDNSIVVLKKSHLTEINKRVRLNFGIPRLESLPVSGTKTRSKK